MTTEVVLDDNREVVLANAVVTASGSVIVTSYGGKEVILFINVSGAVTGSSPTLQFTVQEVDPGDELTLLGVAVTGAVITATGVQIIEVPVSRSSFFKVSWVVTGSSPVFNGTYATLINKGAGASVLYDNLGNSVFGTAGSPGTAVLTVQGVSGGQPSPVSGTVTSNQGTAAALGGAWPVEVTDGTNVLGTATHPVRTDPTGTTTQPVSGTVTAQQATAGNLNATVVQGAGSGAAGTYWYVRVTDGTNTMPTMDAIGRAGFQKITDGTNTAAVTASSALKVDGSAVTQPVSGTVTSNQGTGTGAAAPWSVELSDGAAFYTAAKTGQFPSALVGGRLDTNVGAWLGSTAPTVGQKTMANSVPIAIASDQTAIPASQSGTWTVQQGTPPWHVDGAGAAGSAVTGNPVVMGGSDGTNARYVSVDSSGRLVMVQATASLLNATVTQGPAAALSGYWPVRVTDGTNTLPTADVAARKAFFALTDGTNTTAVKAASTAAAAADPSAVVALSPNSPIPTGSNTIGIVNQGTPASLANKWPVQVTDGTNTMPTGDAVARAIFEKITDGTNTAAVKAASTQAVAADPSLVVTVSPNTANPAQDVSASGALGALNAAVTVTCPGLKSVGFQLAAGTLIGTIIPEVSFDGGTTWNATYFDDPTSGRISSSLVFASSNTASAKTVVGAGGSGMVRVRVSAYTSGTANATVRASSIIDPSTLYASVAGQAVPPTVALVGGSDGANLQALRTDTAGTVAITPLDDRGSIATFAFGGDNRLRTGQESLLFFDTFEGGTVNNVLWTQSTSGMTQAQASSIITLNNGNSLTSGNYSILTSTKSFFLTSEFPLYAQFKARLIPQTNAVIELGFGTVATTAAPTNGCFLRIDSSGNMRAVMNFGGTETTSATLGTLTSANYYSFEVFIFEDAIRIDIDNNDGSSFASVILPLPLTQSTNMTVSHIPVFARVYNSGTTTTAANILLSGVSVQQLDLAMVATWEEQMAGTGRAAIADPLTGSQLQNFSNSAAPSTIATGTLSNTTAAYTTLGGLFAFNTPAGGETDYLLFAYQVPTGFTLNIWTIQIGCVILGAQSSISPTVLQWGIAVGSSAASLATGAPNPPLRQTMGFMQAPKTANVGDTFSPQNLTYSPKVPLVCFGSKYVQIILRVVSGNATVGQINRGFVNIDGFLQ